MECFITNSTQFPSLNLPAYIGTVVRKPSYLSDIFLHCMYSLQLNFDHLFLFSDRPALRKNGRPETGNRENNKIGQV